MSLETLTTLRKSGRSPAVVWVVVGLCPKSIKALADTIAVAGNPASMDWRAVYGLHVDVFDLSDDAQLLDQTIGAIEAARPKAVGVACDAGVIGLSDEHEFTLRSIRRHLANHS